MWQLQWMFSLLPESVVMFIYYTLLAAGVILLFTGKLLNWFPNIRPYASALKLLGIVLTSGTLYLLGAHAADQSWREKVKDLEAKVQLAEEQSKNVNQVVVEKVVKEKEYIKGKTKTITQYIDREVIKNQEIVKYIENCPVPKEIIDIHNQAAEMNAAAEGGKK